ncbi:arylsulfotransferase [Aspergillus campestris IBT 28561]|uniref:Arylsulfotransferase n=1 Tax=Aspergillus campestris (strain IBT 28561) TaxID=1392248 RepID=A0A2I1D7S0_ASPC2|nr:arylsulfotransferase [Aspergillus campestris IBT 28561]PKY05907.1 arylsulfotransferase [Aspergillus campestris IBT 28561]
MRSLRFLVSVVSFVFHHVSAARHDDDLMSFVTLPEVRALKYDVTYHGDRSRVNPGYWFVAPYGNINPEPPTHRYQQYQIGPYIYDADGVLIWAGSSMFDNHNVFDFRAVHNMGKEPHLSLIAQRSHRDEKDDVKVKGSGVVLDQHYQPKEKIVALDELHEFNVHEFNVVDGGEKALACAYRTQKLNLADLGRPKDESFFLTGGFIEFDLTSGKPKMQWDSKDHLALHESVKYLATNDVVDQPPGFDYVHIDSVDKNAAGDYLLSMRFTDAIYLISGEDGQILWRLGGVENDFKNMDFSFSRQHHARFVESNGSHHVISLLNNAADELSEQEHVSSAMIVEVDGDTKVAKLLRRYTRPDGHLSKLRGSVQILNNSNVFVGWSDQGYHTEFSTEGTLLMEARFASDRFVTYRAYKYEFTGRPSAPPDVVAQVHGASSLDLTTTFYVSWNGATDVATWNFYARASESATPVLVGSTNKTDFETMYTAHGFLDWVSVEALDSQGKVLGTSKTHRSTTPDWGAIGFKGSAPLPNDPSSIDFPPKQPDTDDDDNDDDNDDDDDDDDDDDNDDDDDDDGHKKKPANTDTDINYANAKEVAQAVYKAYSVIRFISGAMIFALVVACLWGAYRFYVSRRRVQLYRHIPTDESHAMHDFELGDSGSE